MRFCHSASFKTSPDVLAFCRYTHQFCIQWHLSGVRQWFSVHRDSYFYESLLKHQDIRPDIFIFFPKLFYKGVAQEETYLKKQRERNRRKGNRKDKEPKERRKDRTNERKRKSMVYITVSSLNRLVGKRNISDG